MSLKKWIIVLLSLVLLLLTVLFAWVQLTVPGMPEGAEEIITQSIEAELPPLEGKTGYVYHGDTKIWYESIQRQDSTKGDILLIMGIANDAMAWPAYFMDPLLDAGYRLIRFDNRGTGMTDWFEDWSEETAYTLEDMAGDGVAVMDSLGIAQAHIIGVSLGGMIAQTMAIKYPHRTQSLISMMSSANMMDPDLPQINTDLILELIKAQIKYGLIQSEKSAIKLQIVSRLLLMGDSQYALAIEDVAQSTLYNLRHRRGYNPRATEQQSAATMRSGSRYEALKNLPLPTLLIHGKSDPLINFQHGLKCLELMPHADHLWLEGMGHDIPMVFLDQVMHKILHHLEKVAESAT